MRALYNLLVFLTLPLWVLHTARAARRRGDYPTDWRHKFGFLPLRPGPKRVWVHAVSVGEVMVVAPILRELKSRLPGYEIVVSCTTTTGAESAHKQLANLADYVVFFPFDLQSVCRRALRAARPELVVVAETELWLNFLAEAKAVGAKTAIVNGRVSDRSFPRSRKLEWFYRRVLGHVDCVLAQSQTDAERLVALGAPAGRVEAVGNTKFDQAVDMLDVDATALRADLGIPASDPIVVAGSTRGQEGMQPEEQFILQAWTTLLKSAPNAKLIIAPRHLERTDAIEEIVKGFGLTVSRRSRREPEAAQVLLLDTFGELGRVYAVAAAAVVGGGFLPLGGQNIFQPLAHGVPTIYGPHMQNFRDIAAMAEKAGAGFVAETPERLSDLLLTLLTDLDDAAAAGNSARDLVRQNLGAAARTAERLVSLITVKNSD